MSALPEQDWERPGMGKKIPLQLLADGSVSWVCSSALGGGQTQKGNELLPKELATWTGPRTQLGNPPWVGEFSESLFNSWKCLTTGTR